MLCVNYYGVTYIRNLSDRLKNNGFKEIRIALKPENKVGNWVNIMKDKIKEVITYCVHLLKCRIVIL